MKIPETPEANEAEKAFNQGERFFNGNGVAQDDAKAVELYRQAAEQGHARAQFSLGWMYENERGVKRDYRRAEEWYRKAAEQGYAPAQSNLAVMYEMRRGVSQDGGDPNWYRDEAEKWFRQAAEQAPVLVHYTVGWMYAMGRGVSQDEVKAVEWYLQAVEQGDALAQNNLGVMYANGWGLDRDYRKAVKWYRQAAEQGNVQAQANLEQLLANLAQAPSSGPPPNPATPPDKPAAGHTANTPPNPSPLATPADFSIFRDRLKDGSEGPEMIRIPAGQFRMGDLSGSGREWERPVHTVRIARPFAIGRYAVTFEEYEAYAGATRRPVPHDGDGGRGRRPVIYVSWDDALAYTQWLSEQSGKRYRLPSEAEWEYAARAGTETEFWWGNEFDKARANCYSGFFRIFAWRTREVGSFSSNPWGLFDTAGNVWEWVKDNWHENYQGAPTDGTAWESGGDTRRVVRGGSWDFLPDNLRSADRGRDSPAARVNNLGFRLAQDL